MQREDNDILKSIIYSKREVYNKVFGTNFRTKTDYRIPEGEIVSKTVYGPFTYIVRSSPIVNPLLLQRIEEDNKKYTDPKWEDRFENSIIALGIFLKFRGFYVNRISKVVRI